MYSGAPRCKKVAIATGRKGKIEKKVPAIIGNPFVDDEFSIQTKNITIIGGKIKATNTLTGVNKTARFSKYGGDMDERIGNAKGYFTTHKDPQTGIWNIVDPDGYAFYSAGLNSVKKSSAVNIADSLKGIYINTLGSWSDAFSGMAYTPNLNLGLNYKNTTARTKSLYSKRIFPAFDIQFEHFCDSLVAIRISSAQKTDPFLLGYFTDNELTIGSTYTNGPGLPFFLDVANYGGQALADKDPNYLAAVNWMKSQHGGVLVTPAPNDVAAWTGVLAERYYQIVCAAVKKHDPNHLILGNRMNLDLTNPYLMNASAKYCDILSLNNYHVWTDAEIDTRLDAVEQANIPYIATEFYARVSDVPLTSAGYAVKTVQDQADFFETYTMAMISHKGNVGYHFFNAKELMGTTGTWLNPIQAPGSFRKINRDIYRLRSYLINKHK